MNAPQIVPSSDLRIHHSEVLCMLEQGSVFLAQRSRAIAVLVAMEEWRTMADYVDNLECAVEALQAKLRIATGESKMVDFDPADFAVTEPGSAEEVLDALPTVD
jgi:antitoxin (DNA-binding transcriptional repressor) of toxin-antitoxin stability system